jgi:predicted ATPase
VRSLALQIEGRSGESQLVLPDRHAFASETAAAAPVAMQLNEEAKGDDSKGDDLAPAIGDLKSANSKDGAEKSKLLGDEFLLRTMTRFFGRGEERAKLAKMLTVPRTRLVTITGPGGIGKTRFTLEAIADLAEGEFGDGNPFTAIFVNLSDVTDPSKLFGRIVNTLKGVIQEDENPRDAVVRLLGSQPSPVLILDNFEQLVDEGASLIRNLLAGSPKLRVLVTSRQRLRLDGEQVFSLASLAIPHGSISLDQVSEFPSVGLFIDRAEAASVEFEVKENALGVICRLCATLEGVPLAIELAAARVSLMSTAHILAEVERNRLDFLATNIQDAAPRQQTIRATIAWSFRLLKEDSKRLLCALSVFRGGWTLQAAQAVSGLEIPRLGSMLTDLRDFSLITVSDNEDGLRFSMSEVIREFASDECRSRGELEGFAQLHANHFVQFAEETIPGFLTPEGVHVLQQFKVEHANLVATRTWADLNPSDSINRKIGITLIRFWLSVNWDYDSAILSDRRLKGKPHSTLGLLIPLGGPMEPSSDPDEVSGYLQLLADLFEGNGTAEAPGWILVQLGYTNLGRDLVFARTAAEKGIAILRQAENDTALAHALNALAVIMAVQGEYENARSRNQESFLLLGEDRESKTFDFAVHTEGVIAFMAGDHQRGEACLKQNLAYARDTCDPRSEFAALYVLGRLYNELGRYAEGLETLETASQLFSDGQGQITYLSGYLSCFLGYSRYRLGDLFGAISALKKSLSQFKDSKRTQGFSMTLFFLAEILKGQRQFTMSARIYGANEMFRIKHGRALDHRESEWDRDLREALREELGTGYEEEFASGLGLSEQQAFALALRAFDVCIPSR